MVEHHHDQHLTLKKVKHKTLDNVCHIYFYFQTTYGTEETPARISTRHEPQEIQEQINPEVQETDIDMGNNTKRDSPESRSVVLAPEKKRPRLEYPVEERHLLLQSLHWMLRRPMTVKYESPQVLLQDDDIMDYHTSIAIEMQKKKAIKPGYLFHYASRTTMTLLVDMRTYEIFKVDRETDVLTEEKLAAHWPMFEKSDASEIAQFVDEDAFEKIHVTQV